MYGIYGSCVQRVSYARLDHHTAGCIYATVVMEQLSVAIRYSRTLPIVLAPRNNHTERGEREL